MSHNRTDKNDSENIRVLLPEGSAEENNENSNNAEEKIDDEDLTPDDILIELGGCGIFQVLLAFIIQFMKIVVCWGMGGNAFFAYVPKWRCVDYHDNSSIESNYSTTMLPMSTSTPGEEYWNQKCTTASGDKCSQFEFDKSVHTLVSEFDLVCDKSWVTASIISIQMIGMMLGSIVVGNISDLFGRKRPFISSMALLFVFHLVCYFSVNWQMFAAGRFFIGIGSAFFLSIYCIFQGEYTLSKWRSTAISFPSWAIQLSLFTLFAWLLHDWEYITLMISLGSLAFLPTWCFLPESFRWLIARDRSKDAKEIVKQISKWNKKPVPDYDRIVKAFSEHHKEKTENYSILILFRKLSLLKLTLPLLTGWLSLGVIGYGIGFGIKKLSGNFFLNMFIFAIVSIPSKLLTIYLQNKIGRKYTSVLSFTLCFIGGLVVAIVQNIDTPVRDGVTNGFAFLASAGLDGAWGSMQTLTVEVYPTVVRNTGFGFLSTVARFGAVIGPQFVYLEEYVSGLLYFVVAGLSALSILCLIFLPETMDSTLVDKISDHMDKDRRKENAVCLSNRRLQV